MNVPIPNWRFGDLKIGEKFLRLKEVKQGGQGCLFLKIPSRELDMTRNAVRCWDNQSEFVTFDNTEDVIRILQ